MKAAIRVTLDGLTRALRQLALAAAEAVEAGRRPDGRPLAIPTSPSEDKDAVRDR